MAYYPVDRPDDIAVHGLANARPGLHAVGEYQASGRPFLKTVHHGSLTANFGAADVAKKNAGDEVKVSFPAVTSRLVITNNTNTAIAVYFCSLTTPDGHNADNSGVLANKNYYVLPAPHATTPRPTLDLRVKSRYVYISGYAGTPASGEVAIAAELTGISEAYDTNVDNIEGIAG